MLVSQLSLISYLNTAEEIQQILDKKSEQILSYAFILHDKDVYDKDIHDKINNNLIHAKGELKENHFHIYIKLINSRNKAEIERWFIRKDENGKTINCFSEQVRYADGVINYLTHNTKKSQHKYQYSQEDVISFNIENALIESGAVDDTFQIVTDILQGTTKMDLLRKYGRAYLYHYTQFNDFVKDIERENAQIERLAKYQQAQAQAEKMEKIAINENLPFTKQASKIVLQQEMFDISYNQ